MLEPVRTTTGVPPDLIAKYRRHPCVIHRTELGWLKLAVVATA
jgi:hypothetical protein